MTKNELLWRIKQELGTTEFAAQFQSLKEFSRQQLLDYYDSIKQTPPPIQTGKLVYKKQPVKEETKSMKDTVKANVVNETLVNSRLQVGKMIYGVVTKSFSAFLPKFTWYEKLFTSSEKRKLVELVAVYGLLHLVRTKYDHYALECLTAYINHELQSTAITGLANTEVLGALLKAPVKQ